jgi:hypothetical protein
MIGPVFAQVKNRGLDRFQGRGRDAVRTEWRLITATHNLVLSSAGQAVHHSPVRISEPKPRSPRFLSPPERIAIADLLTRGEGIRAIARDLGPSSRVDDQSRDPPPSAVLCGSGRRPAGLVRVPAGSSSPSACPVDPGLRPVLGAEGGDGLLELFAEVVESIRVDVLDGCTDRGDQAVVGC